MPHQPAAAVGSDDQALLKRFYLQGDDDALAIFVERHRAWALTAAKRYFPAEAEDIVQVSILRLMDCEPEGGLVTNPLGWWHTILAAAAMDGKCFSLRRTKKRRGRFCAPAGHSTEGDDLAANSLHRSVPNARRAEAAASSGDGAWPLFCGFEAMERATPSILDTSAPAVATRTV